jgi:hypothetical protein
MPADTARIVDFAAYRARRDARSAHVNPSAVTQQPVLIDATRRVRAFNLLDVEHRRRMLRHLGGMSSTPR